MNLTALKTWVSGETLTATDLNGEFQNIYTHTITNSDIDSTGTYVLGELVVGSGITAADGGQFHVHTASAGSVQAHADANEAVLENSAASGLSILSGSSSDGNIFFGDAADNDIGKIAYSHSANSLAFTTNGTTALTLSSAQAATFAGDVSVGGALTLTGGLTLNGAVVVGDSASDTLTVNATVTSDLLFTDATYDIGASGATRPRDLHLSRNALMGGTLGVTGLITATGGVSGALTGNVTGDLSGNVTGGTISGSTGLYTSTLATSAGDIGVGTHSPSGLGARTLNIKATSGAGADLTIEADTGTNFGVFYSGATTNDPFSIYSNTGFKFATASDKNATGFDEHMRITSTGVGINCTPKDTLHVKIGTNLNWQFGYPNNSVTTLAALNDAESAYVTARIDAGTLELNGQSGGDVNLGAGVLVVDTSADRVGVNNASPSTPLHVKDASTAYVMTETIGTSTSAGFRLKGDASADYTIFTTQGVGNFGIYDNANTAQRLTIDTSGNMGLGTDSPTAPVDINTSGNTHLIFKYQDSSTQRSFIATNAGVSTNYNGLVIGSNATQQGTQANTGLSSWYQRLGPTDATGDAWSVAYQAAGGSVVERVRILSSGGITFNGDTAAANALDDYEEGTWTPTFTPSTSGSITLAAGGGAYYTKIGQLVTATLSVTVASVSSPIGYVSVNLPFAPNTSNQKGRSGVAIYVDGLFAGHNTRDAIALTEDSSATLRIYQGDSNSNQSDFAQAVGAGTYFNLTVSYIA